MNRTVLWFCISASTYCGALIGGQLIAINNSPKLNPMSKIEAIIKEEKKKFGIKPDLTITVGLTESNEASATLNCINGKEQYIVKIGGYFREESFLRHELYHIFDGHLGKCPKKRLLYTYYFFWAEPRATFYQVTGFKPFNLFKQN